MLARLWAVLFGPPDKWWSWVLAALAVGVLIWVVLGQHWNQGVKLIFWVAISSVFYGVFAYRRKQKSKAKDDG
jgi:membrane protein implicated in regulation of membrane protease activity